MAFEMSNTECYNKMVELAEDKQQYINPIVTKFLKLNQTFFRKTMLCFNDIKSMDINSKKDYDKMTKEQMAMGGKDMHLNKLKVMDK